MCTRLYTDIIAVKTCIDAYDFVQSKAKVHNISVDKWKNDITFTIDDCLKTQERCKTMGVENVFLSDENSLIEWNKESYENFLEENSKYFTKCNERYRLNLDALMCDNGTDSTSVDEDDKRLGNRDAVVCETKKKLLTKGLYTETIMNLFLEKE